MGVLITICSVILFFVAIILVFLVLMQKAKSDGGAAAMGGGVAESTFGAETGNVLSKSTINAAIAFFVLSFGLYLANVRMAKNHAAEGADKLPTVLAPATTPKPVAAPATQTPPPPAAVPPNATKKP